MKLKYLFSILTIAVVFSCKSDAPNSEAANGENPTATAPKTGLEANKATEKAAEIAKESSNAERVAARTADANKANSLEGAEPVTAEKLEAAKKAAEQLRGVASRIAGTYKYDFGKGGNGSLVIVDKGNNRFDFEFQTEGPEPSLNQGEMSGFFSLKGKVGHYAAKGEGGGKCQVSFTFEGNKVTTSLLSGEPGDCGNFGNSMTPNAEFVKTRI